MDSKKVAKLIEDLKTLYFQVENWLVKNKVQIIHTYTYTYIHTCTIQTYIQNTIGPLVEATELMKEAQELLRLYKSRSFFFENLLKRKEREEMEASSVVVV